MTTPLAGRRSAARLGSTLAAGACLYALTAGPAAAQTPSPCYPLAVCPSDTITVTDEALDPGQSFTVSATGFRPGTTVTFTMDGQVLGTAVADPQGVATTTLVLPAGSGAGQRTLLATGTGADGLPRVLSRVLTVNGTTPAVVTPVTTSTGTGSNQSSQAGQSGQSSSTGRLARTGAVVVPAAVAGVGFILGGSAVARAAKKKKIAAT